MSAKVIEVNYLTRLDIVLGKILVKLSLQGWMGEIPLEGVVIGARAGCGGGWEEGVAIRGGSLTVIDGGFCAFWMRGHLRKSLERINRWKLLLGLERQVHLTNLVENVANVEN